jgi:hypothetical protein
MNIINRVLVTIILVLLIVGMVCTFNYYMMRKLNNEHMQFLKDRQTEMQKALGQMKRADEGVVATVNNSSKFRDNVLVDITYTNNSRDKATFWGDAKLKDQNLMQCVQINNAMKATYPLTPTQQKGLISPYSNSLYPNEGTRGYFCFQCPDEKATEFDLYVLNQKIHLKPETLTSGM